MHFGWVLRNMKLGCELLGPGTFHLLPILYLIKDVNIIITIQFLKNDRRLARRRMTRRRVALRRRMVRPRRRMMRPPRRLLTRLRRLMTTRRLMTRRMTSASTSRPSVSHGLPSITLVPSAARRGLPQHFLPRLSATRGVSNHPIPRALCSPATRLRLSRSSTPHARPATRGLSERLRQKLLR